MTNIFDEVDEVDDEPVKGRQLDILEFLTRKKHLTSTQTTTQTTTTTTTQTTISIIRGGPIHKRRTYEL